MVQGMSKHIEQLQNENKTLLEFNAKRGRALDDAKQAIASRDETIANLRKRIAEFEGTLAARECTIHHLEAGILNRDNQIAEMKRDITGTSKVLAETQKISAMRLESMNNLMREVRRLRAEHVCIATNPQNGHVKVISVVKADTYRQFGWIVSEEHLVDRPA